MISGFIGEKNRLY